MLALSLLNALVTSTDGRCQPPLRQDAMRCAAAATTTVGRCPACLGGTMRQPDKIALATVRQAIARRER